MTDTYTPSSDPIVEGFNLKHHGKMDDTAWNNFYSKLSPDQKLHITPDMIPGDLRTIYEDQASEQLHPWFQNEMNYGATNLGNTLGQNATNYQDTIDQLNLGLAQSTKDLNAKEAAGGTFMGTGREERANSLAANYANKYKTAYDTANASATNALTKNEYNYGDTGIQPGLTQYGVSQMNGSMTPVAGQVAKYNPFSAPGQQSALKNTLDTSSTTLADQYLGARIKNPAFVANNRIPTNYNQ